MEFSEVVRRRRMVRSFRSDPLDQGLVEDLVRAALRAPTAGHTKGVAWLVLAADQTQLFWDAMTTPDWRETSSRFAALARAPVIALCLTSPDAYLDRYSEPDKRDAGLGQVLSGGGGQAAWRIPYWYGDAGCSAMVLLLGAVDAGLASCFLGTFHGDDALLGQLGVPPGWQLFGTVLLGHPADHDSPSPSLDRPTPPSARLHWGSWMGERP